MNTLLIAILLIICIVAFVVVFQKGKVGSVDGGDPTTRARKERKRPVRPVAGTRAANEQISRDIKLTKTSRAVDEIDIVRTLSATQPGFRQYCELIGTSMPTGGVTTPYTKQQVAYYDVRCYRLESTPTGTTEQLVAHETSHEPFWFTDESSSDHVYVDLETFGNNTILVNLCNRVMGPGSDFARQFNQQTHSQGAGMPGIGYACRTVASSLANAWGHLSYVFRTASRRHAAAEHFGLRPAFATAGAEIRTETFAGAGIPNMRPALPGRDPGHATTTRVATAKEPRSNVCYDGFGGPGGSGGFGGGHGGGFGGGFGGPGLGGFLGNDFDQHPMGGGMGEHGGYYGGNGGGLLTGMLLGQLLSNLGDSSNADTGPSQPRQSANTLQGYRIIEDVVPLGSPIYCLGELYLSGDEPHMGRSLSPDNTSSYFATKPEAEVLAHLGAK